MSDTINQEQVLALALNEGVEANKSLAEIRDNMANQSKRTEDAVRAAEEAVKAAQEAVTAAQSLSPSAQIPVSVEADGSRRFQFGGANWLVNPQGRLQRG